MKTVIPIAADVESCFVPVLQKTARDAPCGLQAGDEWAFLRKAGPMGKRPSDEDLCSKKKMIECACNEQEKEATAKET